MKVLQISKHFYPHLGGTEQVARDILHALQDNDDVEQKVMISYAKQKKRYVMW